METLVECKVSADRGVVAAESSNVFLSSLAGTRVPT